MTPKQKAEELVNRYKFILMNEDTECGNEVLCTLIAIKSAKIMVDEITYFMDLHNIDLEHKHQFEYWNKVVEELDLLLI